MNPLTGEKGHLLFDGGMGSMILAKGGDSSKGDALNLLDPQLITSIHAEYVAAGSQVITTNTFSSNRLNLAKAGLEPAQVIQAGIACARAAGPAYVALDIGPLGEMVDPYGDLSEEEAYELFAEQVEAGPDTDLIIIETMTCLEEALAALQAAKDKGQGRPVFSTMTFDKNGFTFMGVDIVDGLTALQEAGADAVGVNCSVGPDELYPLVERAIPSIHLPFIVQANAGKPEVVGGQTVYRLDPLSYAKDMEPIIGLGVSVIGGCCGTTPQHIAQVAALL